LRVLDLFSGIGGFSLGLESVGMNTVAFCEMDKFCQKVLKKHWPNVPIHSDIKELDGYEYRGAVELICGGFPCQPFSVAGERRGSLDDRHLWPEMYRVIQEVQPTWILAENVSGLLNLELKNVLSDLETQSYAAQTFVLPACSVDAKHRRDRVWIIAYADRQGEPDESTRTQERERFLADSGCQPKRASCNRSGGESINGDQEGQRSEKRNGSTNSSQIMANPDSEPIRGGRFHGESCNERRETSAAGRESLQPKIGEAHFRKSESGGQDVADSDCNRTQGGKKERGHGENRTQPTDQQSQGFGGGSVRVSKSRGETSGEFVSRLGGVVDGVSYWMDEPIGINRTAHGVPNRTNRLKGLGNAVVPQIVAQLGRVIMHHHENDIDPRG